MHVLASDLRLTTKVRRAGFVYLIWTTLDAAVRDLYADLRRTLIPLQLYIPCTLAIARLPTQQLRVVRQSLANATHLNALHSTTSLPAVLLPCPPSPAAPSKPSLSRAGSTKSSDSAPTSPLTPSTALELTERNWHPLYEDELRTKLRQLERVRLIFLINAGCTLVCCAAFFAFASELRTRTSKTSW